MAVRIDQNQQIPMTLLDFQNNVLRDNPNHPYREVTSRDIFNL